MCTLLCIREGAGLNQGPAVRDMQDKEIPAAAAPGFSVDSRFPSPNYSMELIE